LIENANNPAAQVWFKESRKGRKSKGRAIILEGYARVFENEEGILRPVAVFSRSYNPTTCCNDMGQATFVQSTGQYNIRARLGGFEGRAAGGKNLYEAMQ